MNLGDRMKELENIESDRRAVKGLPLCARLDGRAFHSFTKGLVRPFDQRLTDLMIATTKHLVDETQAVVGYTQSDEISLVWFIDENSSSQYLYDGRFQKLCSILAAYATGFFVHHLENGAIPEKVGQIPLFDCRVWQVPDLRDAQLSLLWREHDAIKNSITMAALSHFSHKEIDGVDGHTKRQMLRDIGRPWEEMPSFFRRGTYVKRVTALREIEPDRLACIPEAHRPTGPVMRTSVEVVDFGEVDQRKDSYLTLLV